MHLLTTSVFVNMKISLSTVSHHLASKNCLILFREQNIFRKKALHLLTFHQLQLTFGMKNFWINSFCMIFDSFFMGASQKFPRFCKSNSFKRWIIFLKNYHGTSVSQRIEMTINSFLWLKSLGNWYGGLKHDKESKNI